jgi:hypothetical protein
LFFFSERFAFSKRIIEMSDLMEYHRVAERASRILG